MTALLEMKQRIKMFFGKYETYLMPVLKFVLALAYFLWINEMLGFSSALNSIFVVLILALLCAILPTNSIMLIGFVMIIGHCYAVGVETAVSAVVLIILLLILFLRFGSQANLALLFAPMGFTVKIPMAVPMGAGLLGSPLTAAPAGSGVILYYFIRMIKEQSAVLKSTETDAAQKLKLILDGLIKNQEMWIAVAAFVVVTLLVYLLRTRSMDYAWRIAVIVGNIVYAAVIFGAGLLMDDLKIDVMVLFIGAAASLVFGLILEFFAFGGDYSRTEFLEFEDDDYYYYVKAVPKASVSASARRIKKISGKQEDRPSGAADGEDGQFTAEDVEDVLHGMNVDFEKKLEESLKDL